MHDDTIELRQPADETDALKAYARPIATAFGEAFDEAEFESDRPVWEIDRTIGAVDGETWVGGGAAYSFRLTVPGRREVPAAGITGVGVSPTHRRRGILTRLMQWLLDQATERGEPIVILHASEGPIYPRFGFGLATLQGWGDIAKADFRFVQPAEPIGRIRMVDSDEALELFPPMFDAKRLSTPGEVNRTAARWRAGPLADSGFHGRFGPKYRVVLEVDGVARGYAIYRLKPEWSERGPKHEVNVAEVTGLDAAAERALWEWIAGIDLVGRIYLWRTPVPHPLLLQLADPKRLGLLIGDGLWLRLLDLPRALEARAYEASGALTLEVTDTLMPANAGRWRIEITQGEGVVTRTDGAPDLRLDTADLAATYLGGFTFADLALAGRVGECRDGAILAADRLFATHAPAWSSTMF
jgi:predicted acetyltransferase